MLPATWLVGLYAVVSLILLVSGWPATGAAMLLGVLGGLLLGFVLPF